MKPLQYICASCIALFVAGIWAPAHAAVPAAPSLSEAELGPRNYTQRGANKIRQGSLLRAEGAEVKTVYVDLQGDLGHRRDQELQTHYSRLAEMDFIAEIAVKSHNVALAERLETTRRKEVERFFGVMQEIRVRAMPKAAQTP